VAYAGPDQTGAVGANLSLAGFVSYTGNPPGVQWKLYSGPGQATFSNPGLTNATVSFNAPGTYTLMLSASDGVHAVAYDATVVTVAQGISLSLNPSGTNVVLHWTGGAPPYTVETSAMTARTPWTPLLVTTNTAATLPMSGPGALFRVRSL
jgi:hypothetical protein